VCELTHVFTSNSNIDTGDVIETVHLEVLLPAFTIGCIVKDPHGHGEHGHGVPPKYYFSDAKVKLCISAVFMVLVGLSMPSIFNDPAESSAHRMLGEDSSSSSGKVSGGMLVLHVFVCSLLMNVGKLFPATQYGSEVNQRTRLALAIGMMPRGEVCAGIIVNAIALGVEGISITIAVLCLAVNMCCVSGFIFAVKQLTSKGEKLGMGDSSRHIVRVAPASPQTGTRGATVTGDC